MKSLHNPQIIARAVAEVLESDPIAAAQVQEYIKPYRLMELLNLKQYLASIPLSGPVFTTMRNFHTPRPTGRPYIDEENT